ncbi:MAG: selenide, water dikinase SelD [Pseudomonadota bacterium]|nr:selenide, water dikinase SelD [Pseudomonadota bacterium]MEC7237309.1 selenide, water dikinase SelD [Pseudomonadota bacterium]
MKPPQPITGELVLVGGGHAQVALLKSLAMKPVEGLRTTLISRDIDTPYSGMLPGYVEGVWEDHDIHIDLPRLAAMAGARMIHAPVTGIDAEMNKVSMAGRPPMRFDVLSLNIGGEPDLAAIAGAAEHAIPVKPISRFRERLAALTAAGHPERIAVIGGGAAGCELALALSKRWHTATGRRPRISIIGRAARLVPELPPRAARILFDSLTKAGCSVHCGHAVTSVEAGRLHLDNDDSHEFDACFLVSAVAPPSWLRDTGLALDDAGFIAVRKTLQSQSHAHIFAAGDVATITDDPRPKAGVYAVRAGPVLAGNIRRFVAGRRLAVWKPQRKALAILGTADGHGVGIRGHHASRSRGWWWLKTWIDRRWMARYIDLKMPAPPSPARLRGLMPAVEATGSSTDPAFEAMRCLGCGAKTGHETLSAAMREAVEIAVGFGADPRLMPPDGLNEDSAILPVPEGGELVQSIDVISEIVTDPFQLGRIAAIHAMSDIYAANAVPVWGMAAVTLGMARADLQQSQLAQLMAGGLVALSEAGAQLVGGHTGESDSLTIGYAVTGWRDSPPDIPSPDEDPVLILTKPLGTGVIMAAHMQLAARGEWVAEATTIMAAGNAAAAAILAPYRPPMTDVTGFGLARHAMNLAERCGMAGVNIDLASLPLLRGAQSLLAAGHRSTLHDQDRDSVRLSANSAASPLADILFDPQTSGGLLAAVPAEKAAKIEVALQSAGHACARVGRLTDTPGITLES